MSAEREKDGAPLVDIGCKCPPCLESERRRHELDVPYRYDVRGGHAAFHLLLHLCLPVLGMVLIGRSWWSFAAPLGFISAWLFNSLYLCPSCPYHHAGAKLCGCYPKSIFPVKRYRGRPWSPADNLIGRSSVILLTTAPPVAVLAGRGETTAAAVFVAAVISAVFLTSVVSCPSCRQRSVCALGKLTISGIRRKDL